MYRDKALPSVPGQYLWFSKAMEHARSSSGLISPNGKPGWMHFTLQTLILTPTKVKVAGSAILKNIWKAWEKCQHLLTRTQSDPQKDGLPLTTPSSGIQSGFMEVELQRVLHDLTASNVSGKALSACRDSLCNMTTKDTGCDLS